MNYERSYLRSCQVSTLEQKEHGYSIEEQERKLKSFCEINDWSVSDVFIDAGFSGAKRDRPELQRMMKDIKRFDLVLVYKLDRLTRNVRDLLDLLEIFEQNNVAFRSATEVYDTSTAMGRLFVTLVGAMAEWERETIRERVMMGKRAAIKQGMILTPPPFYYDRVDNTYVPNNYKKVVLWAYDEVLKGVSSKGIARKLNDSDIPPPNGKRWEDRTITRALRSPITRGHYTWGDVFIENSHEPIITEEMYQQIKERLEERINTKIVSHVSVFRGKFICPKCGGTLTMNTATRKRKKGYVTYKTYYCNTCKGKKKSFGFAENEALRVFHDYLSKLDLEKYEIKTKQKDDVVTIDIDKIMEQRKRYHKLYAKGLMQEEELFELIKETDETIAEYEKQRELVPRKTLDVDKIKSFKNALLESWKIFSLEDKANFIKMAIKSIDIEYVKLKNRHSIKINDIEFY
ncbi:recombinase family protein [Staphylococcus epidermidis]|uniref:recombinase family protein n=1 Tax=Staphylococcus epidermidis TaxID=1282 RepID=UPI0021A5038D|nr:recombinase family protein [Staphylococcus epidermidis]MCT2080618.1 recombinase family protein [Staphylococcus epidermidis]MCT2111909.1 recombinase family protein [Staphylococcus epidermidis]MCT2230668.1 recombinase family protein [Staphylococcus epidermidis]MCT2315426.1 recombinase family protein [Staphylococcus epidermidis]